MYNFFSDKCLCLIFLKSLYYPTSVLEQQSIFITVCMCCKETVNRWLRVLTTHLTRYGESFTIFRCRWPTTITIAVNVENQKYGFNEKKNYIPEQK